jgi:type IX secretion system PorP/SprF family membrane protein
MRTHLKVVLAMICTAFSAQAQYFQFSQYNFAPQRVSPTAPALSNYAKLSFLHRNQGTGDDIRLNTNSLSASYPVFSRATGRRWSGVGVSLIDDRSGGIYRMQEGSLSYAVNVFLNKFQTLTLGFKGLYQQRRMDLSGLYTGSQYIPDRGFDESISNGENLGLFNNNFFTFSSGISWQAVDKKGQPIAYWSASFFDLNKPQESFLSENDRLNSSFALSGGFLAYRESNLSIIPEALFTGSSGNRVLNIGFITRCDVPQSKGQKPFYIDIITKYVVGRSTIAGLQFHNENFSFGVSYDVLVHRNNAANVGALEVGVELRRLIEPRLKNKNPKKNGASNQRNQSRPVAKNQVAKKPVVKKVATDSVQRKQASKPKQSLSEKLTHKKDSVIASSRAGEMKHEPFVLEKVVLHFNFEFNSSELDEASSKYLDELATALTDNPHLKVKLTGHTDNVGSAKFNERLSLHRANAIKQYLVSRGINDGRIQTEGKGLTEPLNDNRTEADRAKNRRVELTILYED